MRTTLLRIELYFNSLKSLYLWKQEKIEYAD
jgi:hypothetical protein